MMISTRRKIQAARAMSAALRATRRLIGLSDRTTTTRGGIRWDLDLAEGIDLAIYLKAYQRIGRRVRDTLLVPGSVAIDIGANVGAFSLPLAVAVGPSGRVYALEATRFAYAKLLRNVELNPDLANRIVCRQVVLLSSDAAPPLPEIYSSWRLDDTGSAARHPLHGGVPSSTEGAACQSLDTMVETDPALSADAGRVTLVKIDVDGNELDVLRGARRFLLAQRPLLLLELAPYVQNEVPGRLEALLKELDGLGYDLEDPENGRPLDANGDAVNAMVPEGAGVDVLCRPRSQVGR